MAFDVGALVSKLKLDSTSFNKSADTAKTKAGSLGSKIGASSAKFKQAGMAMTVAGAAIVTSLGLVIKKAVDAGDWIDKMSKRTGISATSLSELAYAADLSGASLSDVEKSFKKMAISTQGAADGLATYTRVFDQLGINFDEFKKLDPEAQFLEIGEALNKLEDDTTRAAMAQAIFGRAGSTLIPLFKEGKDGIKALREEAHTLGIVFDQEAAAKAAKLKDAQTALKGAMTGVGQTIALNLLPALTDVVKSITGVITKITKWMAENPKLAATIAKIVMGLGGLMAVLGPLFMMLPGIISAVGLLGGAFSAMLGPIGLVVVALGAVVVGFLKVKAAKDAERAATERNIAADGRLVDKLNRVRDAAGLSQLEWQGLTEKYEGNNQAMLLAIQRGEEGEKVQQALTTVAEENKEAYEKATSELTKLDDESGDYSDTLTDGLNPALEDTKDKVESLSDFLKAQGIKTIREKDKRVKELEKHLVNLTEAYEEGTITLEDYTEATEAARDELEGLTDELDGTRKAEKLLSEYLQNQGIPTTEEKTKRVNELKTILGELEKAYKDGRISMADFINATAAAKKELAGLSTEITTTAIPAARDMSGVWEQAVSEMEDNTEGFVRDGVKPKFAEIDTAAKALTDGLKTKWASAFGEMLRGQGVFKIDLKGIWDGIYGQFTDILGSMFSDFLTGGKNAFAGLANALKSPSGFIAAVYLGVHAIWDIGEALSDFLFGAGLNANWEEQKKRIDEYRQKWIDLGYSIDEANKKTQEYLRLSGQGGDSGGKDPGGPGSLRPPGGPRGNNPPRGGFAVGGITAPYPHAVDVGEKYEKEYIVPESKLMNLVGKIMDIGTGAGGTGRNSPVFNLNMSPTVQLMGTISGAGFDPVALQAQIRGTIVPQILQDLLSNLQKSEWQKALGLI